MKTKHLFIALILVVTACSTRGSIVRNLYDRLIPLSAANDATYKLVSADLVPDFFLTQAVSSVHNGKEIELLIQTEKKGAMLSMAATTPFGIEIFRLQQYGAALEVSTSSLVDQGFDPAFLLADMQIALLPLESIQKNLGTALSITESTVERTLTKNDKTVISIRYAAEDRISGDIQLQHIERQYQINIDYIEGAWLQ